MNIEHDSCENSHDHKPQESHGKIAINRINVSDIDYESDEITFFNMRIEKLENLEGAINCKVN